MKPFWGTCIFYEVEEGDRVLFDNLYFFRRDLNIFYLRESSYLEEFESIKILLKKYWCLPGALPTIASLTLVAMEDKSIRGLGVFLCIGPTHPLNYFEEQWGEEFEVLESRNYMVKKEGN